MVLFEALDQLIPYTYAQFESFNQLTPYTYPRTLD